MDVLWIYIVGINVVAFLLYGLDKQKARMNRWRIPEKVLLGLAFAGGSIGAYVGMKTFHHKTHKTKFSVGVPLIFIAETALLTFCVNYF